VEAAAGKSSAKPKPPRQIRQVKQTCQERRCWRQSQSLLLSQGQTGCQGWTGEAAPASRTVAQKSGTKTAASVPSLPRKSLRRKACCDEKCASRQKTQAKRGLGVTDDIDDKAQPLLEHLLELRNRLMWAFGAFFIAFLLCFSFAKPLFNMLVEPFTWAVDWAGLTDRKIELIYTAPQEFFFTQIKIGMFGGLVLAFPMIAAQVYKFVAPGLYKNERSRLSAIPGGISAPVPARRRTGLFLLHADGDVVLPVDGADRRGW
jgi:hypothetical protein